MKITPVEQKPYSVAYFLGAGASVGALPVVNEFSDGILEVIKELSSRSKIADPSTQRRFNEVTHDLTLLQTGCRKHHSVDTYARSFWLKRQDEHYNAVKWQICLFFDLRHYFFPKRRELRYDSLLSSIMDRGVRFPKNVSVVSWNYDYEIEKAYLPYTNYRALEDCYKDLSFFHKGVQRRSSRKPLPVVKVNGTAGFLDGRKMRLGLGCNAEMEQSKDANPTGLIKILNSYLMNKVSKQSTISFAWEMTKRSHKSIIAQAKQKLEEADTIVIIGYSFPTFNKEVDKELFSGLAHGRKTFVLQDMPNVLGDRKTQLERLIGTRDIEDIRTDSNVSQFHIPLEL